jgi:nucleobase:cation symporter-1, NCS1 family
MYARSTSGLSVRLVPDFTQYWLVHRTRVDVPSMYRPRGRYRYTHGIVSPCNVDIFYASENVSQNWRAAAAMTVSVPPTFPGLIDSIKANANVGAGPHLFDIAYMLGVCSFP